MLFWNSLNEIALNKRQLRKFLKKSRALLNSNGKILINIDNPATFNYKDLDYSLTSIVDHETYTLSSRVKDYFPLSRVTITEEKIDVTDRSNNLIHSIITFITQKWWAENDIIAAAKRFGFKTEKKKLKVNEELYLVVS